MAKIVGTVVLLILLYAGLFGININTEALKFKTDPFIKEWISSGKAEESIEKMEKVKDKVESVVNEDSEQAENVDSLAVEIDNKVDIEAK